jgi:hypothetical protein
MGLPRRSHETDPSAGISSKPDPPVIGWNSRRCGSGGGAALVQAGEQEIHRRLIEESHVFNFHGGLLWRDSSLEKVVATLRRCFKKGNDNHWQLRNNARADILKREGRVGLQLPFLGQ